jgi:isopenicillin N synthase-like dioxygenase
MKTFSLPDTCFISKNTTELLVQQMTTLGMEIVKAWSQDGAVYITINEEQDQLLSGAFDAHKWFMHQPTDFKRTHENDLSFSGFFAGEEYEVDQSADELLHSTEATSKIRKNAGCLLKTNA